MLLDCDVLFGPTGIVASALTTRQNGLRHCQHHRRTLKLAHTGTEAIGVITLLDGNMKSTHCEYLSNYVLAGGNVALQACYNVGRLSFAVLSSSTDHDINVVCLENDNRRRQKRKKHYSLDASANRTITPELFGPHLQHTTSFMRLYSEKYTVQV